MWRGLIVDGNGRVSALVDAVYLLKGLVGERDFDCLDAADINDNGRVNLVDAVYLLTWAFNNGDALPDPVECGEEDTDDDLPSQPQCLLRCR